MDVEKDIDAIYKRLNNIDKRLVEIESTRPFLKEMVDRNVSVCELLGETMQEVQYSMRELNEKMELQSTSIKEIREEFNILSDRTNDKIDEVSNKIQLVEDKGKFDILQYIKNNWPLILVLIGLGGAYIAKFIKL
jgi:methyl-accepting chemotaxis protein